MKTFRRRRDGPTRREVLEATLAGAAGLLLSHAAPAFAAGSGKRVVVVGAGFAGLAAAYELVAAGHDVTVVEARRRIGGRVLSLTDVVAGKNVEGGGELIGMNHPAWQAYAKRFGLTLLPLSDDEGLDMPIRLGGRLVPRECVEPLWEEKERTLRRMSLVAKTVDADEPWRSPDAARLDATPVSAWIRAQTDVSEWCRLLIDAELEATNGVATRCQSYLGMLAAVKGGGLDDYWELSETHRCAGGNAQLAQRLAAALPEGRLKLGTPVSAVNVEEARVTVTLADGGTLEADDVILAVPPSTWGRIRFEPALPAVLRPQMGVNVKFLATLRDRFWLATKTSQYATSDADLNQTWEATDGQEGPGVCLTAFSGGPSAQALRDVLPADRERRCLAELEILYPVVRPAFTGSRFMDWPSDPWARASYSFPAPGEVTTVSPALRRGIGGRLHFAGEHCSTAFVGYMEGALQSGVAAAKRVHAGAERAALAR